MEKLEESMCNTTGEIEYHREFKDVIDELKMIERVLENQKSTVSRYHGNEEISS
jgi:hypothetical protein